MVTNSIFVNMKFRILSFGICKDILNASHTLWEAEQDEYSVEMLKNDLQHKFPQLSRLKSFMVAINDEYAEDEQLISENDEVALIPPVSGG